MIERNNSTIATIVKPADNTMIYIFASIMFVGFFGNAKVIVDIFSANKKRRWNFKLKNVTDIFIVNLAFADLSLMLVVAVLITKMSVGQWTLGLLACKFYMTFDGVTKFVSVAFIVLLSFDRYLAVCHPLTSLTIIERHSSTKMLRSSSRRRGDARNKRLTLLILFIVLTYTFCWMPYWVLQFSLQFNGEAFYDLLGDEYFPLFSFAAYALQMCNSALNPYFYLASAYLRN
uniref:G-protein coupled receptors family 1 profile domain-containing protein n=1 Tax=Romanomermis culicivorax TaxID=13658 RepID=A0A915I7V2_ROMCU